MFNTQQQIINKSQRLDFETYTENIRLDAYCNICFKVTKFKAKGEYKKIIIARCINCNKFWKEIPSPMKY